MENNEFPTSIFETQCLIKELLDVAEKEKDRDKRREILLQSIELKDHLKKLKQKIKKAL